MSDIVDCILILNMVRVCFQFWICLKKYFACVKFLVSSWSFGGVVWLFLCVPLAVASWLAPPVHIFICYLFVILYFIFSVSGLPLFRYNTDYDWNAHTHLVYHQYQCWYWESNFPSILFPVNSDGIKDCLKYWCPYPMISHVIPRMVS